jgi:hypothetical protein
MSIGDKIFLFAAVAFVTVGVGWWVYTMIELARLR